MARGKKAKIDVIAGNANSMFTWDDLRTIRSHPHILGLLAEYDLLTEMHSKWILYLWDRTEPNAPRVKALQAHRGSYKTVSCSVIGICWKLLFEPEQTIMLVRKTFSEASATLEDVNKVMKHPVIQQLFTLAHGEKPTLRTERLGEAKLDYSFRKKPNIAPSVRGMGVNSAFTGSHASWVACDDLETAQDLVSRSERIRSMMIWRELVSAVCHKDGFISSVGTPWCRGDGMQSLTPPPLKFDVYSTGIINSVELERIRTETTPVLFALNYELRFANDDSCLFAEVKYADWGKMPQEAPKAHIDMAYGGGDTTALSIASRREDGSLIVIGFSYKGDGMSWLDRMAEILRTYKVRTVSVEQNADKGWLKKELLNRGFSVKEYSESTKKQNKIATYLWELWPETYFDPNTDEEYLLQISTWDASSKAWDDSPDSLASLIRAFFSKRNSANVRWEL